LASVKRAPQGPPAPGAEAGRAGAAPARAVSDGREAAEIALAPLGFGEAPRVGLVGDPGGGKSVAMRYLVAEVQRRSVGWLIIIDDKDPARAQYEGQMFADVVDVHTRGLEPEPRVIVLRGETQMGRDVEPDEAARFAWHLKLKGLPSVVVFDELKHRALVNYGTWLSGIEWTPRIFEKGRSIGIGVIWGCQYPQQIPLDPWETTDCVFIFKTAGSGLAKLDERGWLGPKGSPQREELLQLIPMLKGYPLPLEQRGEFVVVQKGVPWDGKIYRFKAVV
jgi:hypothetical protein